MMAEVDFRKRSDAQIFRKFEVNIASENFNTEYKKYNRMAMEEISLFRSLDA
jgi:hypothetical protein